MSSFKKHVKTNTSNTNVNKGGSSSLLGLKPWINCGLGLVSCGNKQFDEMIGGGLSLGSLTLFGLDEISNHGETLISYNIAESLSIGHETLFLCYSQSTYDKYMKLLPLNQHFKSSSTHVSISNDKNENNSIKTDASESASVSDTLKLANSYKKYIGYYYHHIFNISLFYRLKY